MKTFSLPVIAAFFLCTVSISISAQPLWVTPPGGRTFDASNASIHAATCIIRPEGAYAECEWHISVSARIGRGRDTALSAELYIPLSVPRGSVVMGAVADAPLGSVNGGIGAARYLNLQAMGGVEARTAYLNSLGTAEEAVLIHLDTNTTSEERYIVRLNGRSDAVRTLRIRFYAPMSWSSDEASVRLPCSHLQSPQSFPLTLVYAAQADIWRNAHIAEVPNLSVIQPSSLAPMLTRDTDDGLVYWGTTATIVGVNTSVSAAERVRAQNNGIFANVVAQNTMTFRCVPIFQETNSLALPAFSLSSPQTTERMNTASFIVRKYEREGKGVFQTLFFPQRAWNLAPKQSSRAKLLLVYDVDSQRALTTAASPIENVYNALLKAMTASDSIAVVISTKDGIIMPFATWQSANTTTLRGIREMLSAMQGTMTSLLGTSLVESVRFIERNNPENAGILLVSNANSLFGTNTTANVDILSPATVLQQLRAAAPRLPNIHIADIQTSVAGTQHLDNFYWTLFTNSGGSYGRLWSSNWRSMEQLFGIQIPQILKIQEVVVETIENASLRTNVRNTLVFDRVSNPPLSATTKLPMQTVVLQCGRYDGQILFPNQRRTFMVESEGRLSSRLFLSRTDTMIEGNRTDEDIWAIERAISLLQSLSASQSASQAALQEFSQHCLQYGIVSRQTMLVFAPSSR